MYGRHWTLIAWTVVVVIALAGVLSYYGGGFTASPVPSAKDDEIPPLTPEIQAQLAKSHGFAALISYTDRGFEPAEATIKQGEAIRFTNNSSKELWVASQGTPDNPVYGGQSDCGASAFDTCRALKPKEFWEFTFDKAGTWLFVNNVDKEKSGTVRVVVQ